MKKITFYGADWCHDCKRAKAYLSENKIEYNFIDVDIDQKATDLVQTINNGKRIIPTIIIDEKPYTNPKNDVLAAVLGLNEDLGQVKVYGADWCPDCRRAKSYLQDNNINFKYIVVDKHEWAAKKVEEISPPIMTHPIGDHKEPPAKVSGNKPKIVVKVVIKIGMNRIFAASLIARSIAFPVCLSSLA